jgi:hypothetical protein
MQTIKCIHFGSRFKPQIEKYKRMYLKNKNLWEMPSENLHNFIYWLIFMWSERVLLEHKEEY